MDLSPSVQRKAKSRKKNPKEKKKGKESLKVVYISSPMKVKTSASRFMSLVQELTGKNSDVAQYMEDDRASKFLEIDADGGDDLVMQEETCDQYLSSIGTTTCNSSSYSPFFFHNGLTNSRIEEQFSGIFGSNSVCDPPLLDVLGSYDEL